MHKTIAQLKYTYIDGNNILFTVKSRKQASATSINMNMYMSKCNCHSFMQKGYQLKELLSKIWLNTLLEE